MHKPKLAIHKIKIQQAVAKHKIFHRFGVAQWQISFKDKSVKDRYSTCNRSLMFFNETFHGRLPPKKVVCEQPFRTVSAFTFETSGFAGLGFQIINLATIEGGSCIGIPRRPITQSKLIILKSILRQKTAGCNCCALVFSAYGSAWKR
jgi:hypothetical protein